VCRIWCLIYSIFVTNRQRERIEQEKAELKRQKERMIMEEREKQKLERERLQREKEELARRLEESRRATLKRGYHEDSYLEPVDRKKVADDRSRHATSGYNESTHR
jgi:hypothetical protein